VRCRPVCAALVPIAAASEFVPLPLRSGQQRIRLDPRKWLDHAASGQIDLAGQSLEFSVGQRKLAGVNLLITGTICLLPGRQPESDLALLGGRNAKKRNLRSWQARSQSVLFSNLRITRCCVQESLILHKTGGRVRLLGSSNGERLRPATLLIQRRSTCGDRYQDNN
jgi:hypothetical protein